MGEPRRASVQDSFMGNDGFQDYKPLHAVPVRPLATVIGHLKNYSREHGRKEIVDDIRQLDDRFILGRIETVQDSGHDPITSARPKVKVD